MIVRDNSSILAKSLQSIRPWVDELIVVDTGSTDNTKDIAIANGARVDTFPWCDSFSTARNHSLSMAAGEWIMWMDSDEQIAPSEGEKLRLLFDSDIPPRVAAFQMQVECPYQQHSGDHVATVQHIKAFRNGLGIHFSGRVHEQLWPSVTATRGLIAHTNITIQHSLADRSPDSRARKFERDMRLLQISLSEAPSDPFILFNIGMTYSSAGQYARAIAPLRTAISQAPSSAKYTAKAQCLLILSLMSLQMWDVACDECDQVLREAPRDRDVLCLRAILAHHEGDAPGRISYFRRALSSDHRDSFGFFDRCISSDSPDATLVEGLESAHRRFVNKEQG